MSDASAEFSLQGAALRLLRECLDETANAPVCPWCGRVDGPKRLHRPNCWRLDAMALLADAAKE